MIEKIFSHYKTNLTPDQTMKDQIWQKVTSSEGYNNTLPQTETTPPVKHFFRNLFRNGLIAGGVMSGLLAFVLVMVLVIPVVQTLLPYQSGKLIQNTSYQAGEKLTNSDLSGLEKIKSCADLSEKLKSSQQANTNFFAEGMMLVKNSASTTVGQAAPSAALTDSSSKFTATNVQVAGIDESDIVKTDGKTVFSIDKTKNVINVVSVYPANRASKLTEIIFKDAQPQEIFLENGKLIVISYAQFPVYTKIASTVVGSPIAPYPGGYGTSTVRISVYDITVPTSIDLLREYDVEGNFVTARLVNGLVYLISNKYSYSYLSDNRGGDEIVPMYSDNTGINKSTQPTSKCTDMAVIGDIITPVISTVSVIDLENNNYSQPTFFNFIGSTQTVYMSYKNIYLVSSIWQNRMPMASFMGENQATRVTKIAYYQDKLKFVAQTEFAGQILNQFSLDEDSNGVLRLAGTKGDLFQGTSQSYLYTFGNKLDKLGEVTNLARGEKIYSVRFYDNIGVVVTFKKVDPLFVFDLIDPKSPKLKGELKIPGFSDYLHFISKNIVVGFGKDAIEASGSEVESRQLNFAWYQGLKLAVFDISDLSNPKQISQILMGDRGSDSEALTNHKAFVFDQEHNLIIVPALITKVDQTKCGTYQSDVASCYGTPISQGAMVIKLNTDNTLKLIGQITHYPDNWASGSQESGYYGENFSNYSDYAVNRSIVIGEEIITISNSKIKINQVNNLQSMTSITLKEVKKSPQVVY